jgi:hypothetical protein
MAGDLVSSGRGQLDDHDRDRALQQLAAVSLLRPASASRSPRTLQHSAIGGCARFFTLIHRSERRARWCRGASGGLLFAVPELTRSDGIKLNERVLLPRNPHRIS